MIGRVGGGSPSTGLMGAVMVLRGRPALLAPLALMALLALAALLAGRGGWRARAPAVPAWGGTRGTSAVSVWLPSGFCSPSRSPEEGVGGAGRGLAPARLREGVLGRVRAGGGMRFISLVDFDSLEDYEGITRVCGLVRDLGETLWVRVLSEWAGFGGKVRENLSAVQTNPALGKELVVLIDALDMFSVRHQGDPREFQAAFAGFGVDVVISGERGVRDFDFDPSQQEVGATPPRSFAEGGITTWPTQANAGFLAGLGKDLEMFLSALLDWARPPNTPLDSHDPLWDDQTALQLFLRAGTPGFSGTWALDDHSILVHTCAFDQKENFEMDSDKQQIGYRVAGDGVPDRAPDRILDPFFFHAPGNSAKRVCLNVSSVARSWRDGGRGNGQRTRGGPGQPQQRGGHA